MIIQLKQHFKGNLFKYKIIFETNPHGFETYLLGYLIYQNGNVKRELRSGVRLCN